MLQQLGKAIPLCVATYIWLYVYYVALWCIVPTFPSILYVSKKINEAKGVLQLCWTEPLDVALSREVNPAHCATAKIHPITPPTPPLPLPSLSQWPTDYYVSSVCTTLFWKLELNLISSSFLGVNQRSSLTSGNEWFPCLAKFDSSLTLCFPVTGPSVLLTNTLKSIAEGIQLHLPHIVDLFSKACSWPENI